LLALNTAPAAFAQPDPVTAAATDLKQASDDVRAVEQLLERPIGNRPTRELRDQLAKARATASDAAKTLDGQLALLDARAAQLGPVTPGVIETPDITAERRRLSQQRSAVDTGIKRSRLVAIEAADLQNDLDAAIEVQRGRTLLERVPSLVTPMFWQPLMAALPADGVRLRGLFGAEFGSAFAGARSTNVLLALLGLLAALTLLVPVRMKLRTLGRQFSIDRVPGHRARRSCFALWRLAVGTAIPGLAAIVLVMGIRSSGMVNARWDPILNTFVPAAFIAAFITALAGALLLRSQPTWRLLPIDDLLAKELLPWAWLLSALALVHPLLVAINSAARASQAAQIAADTAEALVTLVVVSGALAAIGRRRRLLQPGEPVEDSARHPLIAVVVLIVFAAIVGAAIAILIGYVSFALWLLRALVLWPTIVVSALYLLFTVTDDLARSLFSASSRTGLLIVRSFGMRPSSIDQFGVLLSGVLRVALAVLGIGSVLTPFGAGLDSFFGQLEVLADGITIGQVTISPGAVLRSVFVFTIGLVLAKGFLRWLNTSYLPATELDNSARNSVALVTRYIGILIAVLWGLAALGIGMERIALLLSALSVGIGFGLQAITQNFISGLILLAERPVKIGDLIRIGNDEGDVKRISVRSTEIELADHSTLIVPNSKLITETVLNKTLASPLGRLQIQFAVPLGTDPVPVRNIVLEAFRDHPAVLDTPPPSVFIDGISKGEIAFNCFAHVAGPREVYGARSGVLMQILQRFVSEGIEVGSPITRMEVVDNRAGMPATSDSGKNGVETDDPAAKAARTPATPG
jgi:potassium efflux system protein